MAGCTVNAVYVGLSGGHKLVRLSTTPDSPSGARQDLGVRFMSRYFLRPHEELLHGIELIAIWLQASPREVEEVFAPRGKEEQMFYTVEMVHSVLTDLAKRGEGRSLVAAFSRMLAYDALLGVNDRHAMNWGLIRDTTGQSPLRFAPLFDTARGLFWHHRDEDLARHDARGERAAVVEQYAGGSRPLFGCAAAGHGDLLNHFEIVEFLLAAGAPEFRPALNQVIAAFNPGWVTATLNRTFGPLLRRRRLEWIDSLLRFRHARLVSLQGAAT